MSQLMQDQEWYADALCAQTETDPEEFFPEKGGSTREAKAVCNGDPDNGRAPCPVKAQCLEWALLNEERFGIFGGHSERERRRMKKDGWTPALAATGTDVTVPLPAAVVDEQPAPPRQYGLPYVGGANGGTHYPLPNPDKVTRIEQRGHAKPSIDWDKIRAQHEERRRAEGTLDEQPAPVVTQLRCRWCREPAEDLVDDVCKPCRDDAEQKFTVPTVPTTTDLLIEHEARASVRLDGETFVVDREGDLPSNIAEALDTLERDELPMEGKQGQPTTGSSAPGATSTSSQSGRAPARAAGSSTTREKNPAATRETRPAVAAGLDQLIDDLAHVRATLATELTRIELALDQALTALRTPVAVPAPTTPAATSSTPGGHPDTATGTTFETFPRSEAAKASRRRAAAPRRRVNVDVTKARELLEQGHSCPEIARELGVAVSTVRRALNNAGITVPDGRSTHSGGRNQINAYPEQLVNDVRRLYLDQQLTQAQVAAQLDTTVKVVQSVMARHNIPARPSAVAKSKAGVGHPIKLDDQTIDQLVDRYQAGESANALARAFAVSVPSVLNRLRQRGVQIRGRGGNHRQAGS